MAKTCGENPYENTGEISLGRVGIPLRNGEILSRNREISHANHDGRVIKSVSSSHIASLNIFKSSQNYSQSQVQNQSEIKPNLNATVFQPLVTSQMKQMRPVVHQ